MKRSFLMAIGGAVLLCGAGLSKGSAQVAAREQKVTRSVRFNGDFLPGAAASGEPALAGVHGNTRDAGSVPLPQVEVDLRSADDGACRTILSDSHGAFTAAHLKPGRYALSASKKGFASSVVTSLTLAAGQDLQVNLVLDALPSEALVPALRDEMVQPSIYSARHDATEPERALPPHAADPPVPAAVWEQIDELKRRVEQLEAELHGRNANALATAACGAATSGCVAHAGLPAPGSMSAQAHANAAALAPSTQRSTEVNPPALQTTAMNAIPPSAAPVLSPAAPPRAVAPLSAAPANPIDQAPQTNQKPDPFSDADWSWLNGNARTKDIYWGTKFFTPEIRADLNYTAQNHHPGDHTLGGSTETFRSGEVQLEQLGVGGDFHWENVRARLMTQFGMYSETTPRNDASPANGQWNLDTAYRYLSEAYGGYHFNVLNGINIDAGIFLSYIGLFSYYNFDNWAYQPSYVSSNTPWFFNGVRLQIFPTEHLKIEPWFINGWQSYASANNRPGLGGQIKWTPRPWVNIISNNYGLGHDDLYAPGRARIHTDDSVEIKYYDKEGNKGLDKMAFSFTGDLGCEYGGGVSCTGNHKGGPKQSFVGAMLYNRWWFDKDQFGVTLGGGGIDNPGRYLVLLPPINGMTAPSGAINSPYFTENPGDKFKAWDASLTFDWMPRQYITFRVEGDYRHANVPYWSGRGGITPPAYANTPADFINGNGYATEYACNNGAPSGATSLPAAQMACSALGGVWFPDLVKSEAFLDFDILVKF